MVISFSFTLPKLNVDWLKYTISILLLRVLQKSFLGDFGQTDEALGDSLSSVLSKRQTLIVPGVVYVVFIFYIFSNN
jgi:hypothetical protein